MHTPKNAHSFTTVKQNWYPKASEIKSCVCHKETVFLLKDGNLNYEHKLLHKIDTFLISLEKWPISSFQCCINGRCREKKKTKNTRLHLYVLYYLSVWFNSVSASQVVISQTVIARYATSERIFWWTRVYSVESLNFSTHMNSFIDMKRSEEAILHFTLSS